MRTLSVAIIANNSERTIRDVFDSIKDIADEIIVLDSGSTDATPDIAKEYTPHVFYQEWLGFAEQKNKAFSFCTKDVWLSLDADEVLTDGFKAGLKTLLVQPTIAAGYYLNRRTYYLGKLLRFSWYPDYTLRLVCKNASPQWVGHYVHEVLTVEGETARLPHYVVHYSYASLKEHMDKTVNYSRLGAFKKYKANKRFHYHQLLLNPLWAFIRFYFIRRGFLDGFPGFVAAFSAGLSAFLKYLFLRDCERQSPDK